MALVNDTVDAFVDYADVDVPHAAAGSLAGLTVAVKDIYDVAGYPTGCGQPQKRAESVPADATAPAVQALFDAGARFIGKTHTDELAFSLNGKNSHYGTPVNVAAPGRIPGGSSSGSAAATAASLVDFAVGSDTGGSVRAPASYCGLIGLRPTHGRIPIDRVMPLAPSFDTVGWFARDIETYARVGEVLLGDDAGEAPASWRPLIAEDTAVLLMDAATKGAFAEALDPIAAVLGAPEMVTLAEEGLDTWYWTFRVIQGFEAWAAHGAWIESRKPELGPGVAERFQWGRTIRREQADGAGIKRAEIRGRLDGLLGDDGVLILPTVPGIAPALSATDSELERFRERALKLLCASGLTGLPQISLPLAIVDGCPLGVSLIGPRGSDRALIDLAGRILASR
ncbi:MAG: amidase [Hyphomicrobiales bacterium]|nr:amidase [Hyphomicrobiales bacterium]